ncbi:hypothetical protein HP439_05835 [Sphingobacterium shayense]|uniref:WxcM-like domain-containing protein n=1 Tax=Sphingobacterium shayense TaxID=626343 RepID=UPI0015571DFF|nr:WxcM-like domain-containing protein [Sphingobacterium shayense]NQD70239.1 hypothetical protein [Sphingobacterium shayense]
MIDIIEGGIANDFRGQIRFVNHFDMSQIKRFYLITNANIDVVRGWRAHRMEQRWFYVVSGTICIDFVKIDDWIQPSIDLEIERRIMSANDSRILHLPSGYGAAFQSLKFNSELLVFSDYGIENAKNDDYAWPANYFVKRDGCIDVGQRDNE